MTTTVAAVARVWALLGLVVGLSSCRPTVDGGQPHTGLRVGALAPLAADGVVTLDPVDTAELIEAVSRLRELPFGEPVTIGEVDDAGLREMVAGMLASPRGRSVFVGDARTMQAFNTAGAAAPLAHTRLAPALSTELGGYFDPNTRRVYVRRRGTERDEWQWRTTVVHELAHALQHEHFGSLEPAVFSEDSWLASRALVEGDARLISMLYISEQDGYPKGRVLHMLASRTFLGEIVDDPLSALPPAVGARLSFEYWEGAAFVATLVRTGGMKLLDRAFAQPPSTTEQVLHPAKYLAGEQGVELAPPKVPRGYRSLGSGTRGELLIRLMAERCLSADKAQAVAAGWGGDAFVLANNGRGAHALLWRTVWDTAADAKQFMSALASRPACWTAPSEEGRAVGSAHWARRQGRQVALARGLDEGLRKSVVRRMLRSPLSFARRRPLSNLAIAPLPPVAPRRAGRVAGSRYRSPWLGVAATVPPGWRGKIPTPAKGATYPNEL
ncbi:MAG: hypothetical protein JRI68_25000, partial [Deltaproteobacteria bacterium]|nr:hypothetical protein [Deltaproteobacteria bacterium]